MSTYEPLLQRARTAIHNFPPDSTEQRQIRYIDRRLSAPPINEDDTLNHQLLARRLADLIRPRANW